MIKLIINAATLMSINNGVILSIYYFRWILLSTLLSPTFSLYCMGMIDMDEFEPYWDDDKRAQKNLVIDNAKPEPVKISRIPPKDYGEKGIYVPGEDSGDEIIGSMQTPYTYSDDRKISCDVWNKKDAQDFLKNKGVWIQETMQKETDKDTSKYFIAAVKEPIEKIIIKALKNPSLILLSLDIHKKQISNNQVDKEIYKQYDETLPKSEFYERFSRRIISSNCTRYMEGTIVKKAKSSLDEKDTDERDENDRVSIINFIAKLLLLKNENIENSKVSCRVSNMTSENALILKKELYSLALGDKIGSRKGKKYATLRNIGFENPEALKGYWKKEIEPTISKAAILTFPIVQVPDITFCEYKDSDKQEERSDRFQKIQRKEVYRLILEGRKIAFDNQNALF